MTSRRHPAVVLGDRLLQHGTQAVHALAGAGGDLQDRCVADERQLARQLGQDVEPGVGLDDQLPLVEHDEDRAPSGVDPLGQPLVLTGGTLGGVDHQEGDVGIDDRPQGTDERVVLGRVADPRSLRMPAVSTNTIGPSTVSTSVSIASRVVPGRSWTTDGPPHQAVEQGALAHVRPPDDRDPWRPLPIRHPRLVELGDVLAPVGRLGRLGRLVTVEVDQRIRTEREAGDHHVEQVTGAGRGGR